MFAWAVLKIAGCGVLAELFQRNRLVRTWAFLLFAAVASVMVVFFQANGMSASAGFIYKWFDNQAIKTSIILGLSARNIPIVVFFAAVLCISLYYNIFYPKELRRLRSGGFYALIFTAMMLLVASTNIMQLLVSVFFIDLMTFYLLWTDKIKRKFLFYNFISDVLLMLLLAAVWGIGHKTQLNQLLRIGANDNRLLLGIIWLTAVFLKSGLFLFHNYILDWQENGFVRSLYLFYGATPLAGLIIMLKTADVGHYHNFLWPALDIFAALTMLGSFAGSIRADNLKAKMLYWNLMLLGLMFALLSLGQKELLRVFPLLPLCGVLISSVILLPMVGAAYETSVSKMGGFAGKMKLSLGLTFIALAGELHLLINLINEKNYWWIMGFAILHLLSLTFVIGRIYFGQSDAGERVWVELKNPHLLYWFVPLLLIAAIWFAYPSPDIKLALFLPLCIFLSWCFSKDMFNRFAIRKDASGEYAVTLFNLLLIEPLKVLGRVLWLLIDFVLLEKVLYSLAGKSINLCIAISMRLHGNTRFAGAVFFMSGLMALAAVYYFK